MSARPAAPIASASPRRITNGSAPFPAIILSALLFIPYYWKAGIYTVPEFLGRRYNQLIRVVQTILWGAFMVFLLGQFFWASGLMLEEYIGIPLTVEILACRSISVLSSPP